MSLNKQTIKTQNYKGKRVLVRVDFNVPLDKNSKITDDTRIRSALPTINYLRQQGASVILMSHLGRPKGPDPAQSLKPVAARLSELLDCAVAFAPDCIGEIALNAAKGLKSGEILLLENVRFYKAEEKNDPDFAKALAQLGDAYVNDAFGSAHRAHASVEAIAHFLPSAAGFLLEREIDFLGRVISNPERPLVAILGGAKISDKLPVINNLLPLVNKLIIGGGMANTFFKAHGYEMGDSLVEDSAVDAARSILAQANEKLVLPSDVVIADAFSDSANHRVCLVNEVTSGWRVLDIGPKTAAQFSEIINTARMVVWNGPMGVFEFAAFAQGTNAVAHAVAESHAISIIGGGDSVAAIEQSGLADKISHISTGGGASLEFLEGKQLPGVAVLPDLL
jgi:phosphoglycerate kinase